MTLSPSGAARRVACPGSHKLSATLPKTTSEYAQEGILAHKVAVLALTSEHTTRCDDITDEMIEGAKLYAGFIHSRYQGRDIHIEESISIHMIHPECKGTPDAWTYDLGGEIDIYDYKFGHSFVEVFENWQLIEYAAGVLYRVGANSNVYVNMHIIQPRSFHPDGQIRSWRILASDLIPYFEKLKGAECEATSDNPRTRVSQQCNYCPARHVCPALQAAAMDSIDASNSAIPHNITTTELSTELRFLEHAASILSNRISGLQAEALAMLSRGERLPHYYAEHGRGREHWTIPAEDVIALGEMMGVPLSKPVVITPKQAIALKSPMLPESRVKQLSRTPYGALKLMPIDTRKTDKIFGGAS